ATAGEKAPSRQAHYCKRVDAYRLKTCATALLPAGPLGRQLAWELAQLAGEAATPTAAAGPAPRPAARRPARRTAGLGAGPAGRGGCHPDRGRGPRPLLGRVPHRDDAAGGGHPVLPTEPAQAWALHLHRLRLPTTGPTSAGHPAGPNRRAGRATDRGHQRPSGPDRVPGPATGPTHDRAQGP